MKISDIMGKKDNKTADTNIADADRLERERADAEQMLNQAPTTEPGLAPVQEAPDTLPSMPPGMQMPPQGVQDPFSNPMMQRAPPQGIPNQMVQQPQMPQQPQAPRLPPGVHEFTIVFVLETGDQLPVKFPASPAELEDIMKEIKLGIEFKKTVSIGSYVIPGERILFVQFWSSPLFYTDWLTSAGLSPVEAFLFTMDPKELTPKDLKKKLNLMYDEVEFLDKQIDMLILKRNNLKDQIETGVGILLVMDK